MDFNLYPPYNLPPPQKKPTCMHYQQPQVIELQPISIAALVFLGIIVVCIVAQLIFNSVISTKLCILEESQKKIMELATQKQPIIINDRKQQVTGETTKAYVY